jgi:hypothetical protein
MTDFVMVPVPSDRVLEVYALLATDPASHLEANGTGPLSPASSELPSSDAWNYEMIELLMREASNGVRLMFDYLSDRPDQEIPADDLAAGIDRTRDQLNGILGVFGRNVINKYQLDTWPFRAMRSGSDQTMVYVMTEEVAEMVKRARKRS